jgi:hypothetical protein
MSSIFHEGEQTIQELAGVRQAAERVGGSIGAVIPSIVPKFLRNQRLAVLATADNEQKVWASLLTGPPGFVTTSGERSFAIDAFPTPGDPAAETLRQGETLAGLLVIDLETRRRLRVNGTARLTPTGNIWLEADQVYSNCPKYIQVRHYVDQSEPAGEAGTVWRGKALTDTHRAWISQADTFFIASLHPAAGADASHRGGNPGFIKLLADNRLAFPDYSGNNMFNTLGNLAVNPKAGLLFVDFERGSTLQLSGRATIIWEESRVREFRGAERVIEFRIEQVVELAPAQALRWQLVEYSDFNP